MGHSIFILAIVAAAACTPMKPAASSSAVLPIEGTYVIVVKPAQPAAVDAVRLFTQRGFTLVDMTGDSRGVTLRFRGERKVVAEQVVTALDVVVVAAQVAEELNRKPGERRHQVHHDPQIEEYEIGSVFYVRVEPRGETMTSISAVGRPTRSGVEACTNDVIAAPCAPLETGPSVHNAVAGYAEAEVIHGVFSEMRVEGSVIAPAIAMQPSATSRTTMTMQRCLQRRVEVQTAADRVSSSRAKQGILRTMPDCNAIAAAN